MRGSINIDDVFALSEEDITLISQIIQSNLKTTKETQLPFF